MDADIDRGDHGGDAGPEGRTAVTAALCAIVAADWLSGTCVLAGGWQHLRSKFGRRRPAASTPLADEIEAWLRHQGT